MDEKKEAAITICVIIGGLIGAIALMFMAIYMCQYFVGMINRKMDENNYANCQRAIEYNLKIPSYCNIGVLDNTIKIDG